MTGGSKKEGQVSPTEEWYMQSGWIDVNALLTELAAKNISWAYVENFEILPSDIDNGELARVFNREHCGWKFKVNGQKELIACMR